MTQYATPNREVTGGEAGAVASAVAECQHAATVGALRAEMVRTMYAASRRMVKCEVPTDVVTGPVGIAVRPRLLMSAQEGMRLTRDAGRFWLLAPRCRWDLELRLVRWSVDDTLLTKVGETSISRYRNARRQRTVAAVLRDLRRALDARYQARQHLLAKIPKGATVTEVFDLWPEYRREISGVLGR